MDFAAELNRLREEGLERWLPAHSSPTGRVIQLEGRELVNAAGNDYLGLAGRPELAAAAAEAAQKYGAGAGASRLVSGSHALYDELEEELARFKGTEAALVFSSGYHANSGTIPVLCGRSDVIFADRLNHASLVDGCLLARARLRRYDHASVEDLALSLRSARVYRRKLIVTDSVFSMDGDVAPLAEIARLAGEFEALLMVDEAHAFGVLGASGAGAVEEAGVADRVTVQMGTLSKAAGALGGFIAGSRDLVNLLVNRARPFIYSTALPPPVVGAALAGVKLMRREPGLRHRLLRAARELRAGLSTAGLAVPEGRTPIIPLVVGESRLALEFSRALFDQGVFAPAIRPPTVPAGTERVRLSVSAAHTEEDLARIRQAVVKAAQKSRLLR